MAICINLHNEQYNIVLYIQRDLDNNTCYEPPDMPRYAFPSAYEVHALNVYVCAIDVEDVSLRGNFSVSRWKFFMCLFYFILCIETMWYEPKRELNFLGLNDREKEDKNKYKP